MKPSRPHIGKGGTYPQEFREEAVRYWLSSGQTLKAVASDLGVTADCLRNWHRQMEAAPSTPSILSEAIDSGQATTPSATPSTPSAKELARARELGELRRELDAMTRQHDI